MAKARRATIENNRKMTDFFSLPLSLSCRPPSSSAPVSNSATRQATKAASDPRNTTLAQTQPSAQMQSRLGASPRLSQLRAVTKENAPPPPRRRNPSQREVEYVSSSSETSTHISISSTSVVSIDSSNSIVEMVPPVKQGRRHLQTLDVPSSSPLQVQRRRSPRLQSSQEFTTRGTAPNAASQSRKSPKKKRKKPEGVQSDDGDVIDLDAMQEVIYVSSKPPRVNLVTPEPSVRAQPSSSRKRTCLKANPPPDTLSDVVEIVPSSQSDEHELSIPKKNLREITESVREWQLSSSQSSVPPDTFEPSFDDPGMDIDMDQSLSPPEAGDVPKTPVSASEFVDLPSQLATLRNAHSPIPANPSPLKTRLSAIPDPIQIPSSSKSPSPQLVSSASSITRVNTPMNLSSPTKFKTPNDAPSRKSAMSETTSPCLVATQAGVGMDIDIPLLDQNKKTNDIVERIRAEARAKAMATPNEDSLVLGSLDDSDSELGSPSNLFSGLKKGKEPTKTADSLDTTRTPDRIAFDDGDESPLTDVDEVESQMMLRRQRGRRQPRRSTSPASGSSAGTRKRKAPSMLPTLLLSAASGPSKKTHNPFPKLLKEKARVERFAEIHRNVDSDANPTSPIAAGSAEGPSNQGSQLRRQDTDDVDIEHATGEADRRKLLDAEDKTALRKLIASERQSKGKGKAVTTELGVLLWEAAPEDAMERALCVATLPLLKNAGEDSSVELLKELIVAKDEDGIASLLQSGLFTLRDVAFIEWLFESALCSIGTLATSAHTALAGNASRDKQDIVISISPVLRALSKFRARKEILDALHLEVPHDEELVITFTQRSEALWRLCELIRILASEAILDGKDVPSYFALLIVIGMDENMDINRKLSSKRALQALISTYCGEFSNKRGEMEMRVCSSVLDLVPLLSPENREYLLSFIDGDHPIARRIGQWIAFAMLTGDYGSRLASTFVAGPPPLADIIAMLDSRSESELRSDLFNIRRNSEESNSFDYVALGHNAEILGRVLMNISQYAQLEKTELKEMRSNENLLKRYSESSKLDTIKGLLERLCNNIADTRAADLDRSQAKAVIQQLAMRVHYQRKIVNDRPKIDSYFTRKSK